MSYDSRLILHMKDIISAIDEALLLLCAGERKPILIFYNELLLNVRS